MHMNLSKLQEKWKSNYACVDRQLNAMASVKGVVSAFNANIDAVIKLSGTTISKYLSELSLSSKESLQITNSIIRSPEDVLKGLVSCFQEGKAEEWIIESIETYEWLNQTIGYDRLQMGGQGGIIANLMGLCDIEKVFCHTASASKEQTSQFLNLPNLFTMNEAGSFETASSVNRAKDVPLIHWILEFDKGDKITVGDQVIECPKSNRFIATYDPLNLKLHVDPMFAKKILSEKIEYFLLSGFQMLQAEFDNTRGTEQIDACLGILDTWKEVYPDAITHLELASTQDKLIRDYVFRRVSSYADSIGFNERELIDLLEIMGEDELARQCEQHLDSVNLFKGMLKVLDEVDCERAQLHMFGLYVTIQRKGFRVTPLQNRDGMSLAAVVAASKATLGELAHKNNLLEAKNLSVHEKSLYELASLNEYIESSYGVSSLLEEGIADCEDFDVIAVPTIIVEKPVTLVGMGDTISSVSLIGAR